MKHISILLALTLTMTLCAPDATAQRGHNYQVSKNLEIFNRVYKVLDEYYVDTLSADTLIPDVIQYMLEGLDPYTEYIPADDTRNLEAMTNGKYAGIGAIIHYDKSTDRCAITEPYAGAPAATAGLHIGDVILSIDDKDVGVKGKADVGDYTQRISKMLRGDPGTSFTLEVQRPGESKPLRFVIHRASVTVSAVPYYGMVDGDVGYILLTTFTRGCSDQVLEALRQLKQQGARRLILDLRNNGGGLAVEAVNLVNLFVPKGQLILRMKGKYKTSNMQYLTRNRPEDTQIPLVVLVNGLSASSSEITCGALQDLDRAVIMGTRTYGKGLVQQPHELPYGNVLKLTTSHYYIPSGRCIQALDYKPRSSDGQAYRTPDSLTHVFHTAAGRPVRDGGGITPDVPLAEDTLPNLIYYLRQSDAFAHFCDLYRTRHDSIAPADRFVLTDAEYAAFKDSLKQSDFTYDRQSYKALQQLRKIAKSEGYAESAAAELDALERKLTHDLGDDLDHFKPLILDELNANIALRYYNRRGYYASLLPHDKQIPQAIKLLKDTSRYNKILRK